MSALERRAAPFLVQCGSCDAGLPMSCTCPDGDYRPAMLELVQALEPVVAAWREPGPRPDIHYAAQARLRREWPALARALDRLM